jgi:hypothetical protein
MTAYLTEEVAEVPVRKGALVTELPPDNPEVCDACQAPAAFRVTVTAGDLTFCGHHAQAHGFTQSHASWNT